MSEVANRIYWERNTVSIEGILQSIGARHGSSPEMGDLVMFNQETAPDPLELLIAQEESETKEEVVMTTVKAIKQKTTKQVENEQITLTPALKELLHSGLQRDYQQMVNAAGWVARMLAETTQFDYLPDIDEVRNAIPIAVEGVELYAYCRDDPGAEQDPSRKSLSGNQWRMLTGNAETILNKIEWVNAVREAGFQIEASFEDAYNVVKSDHLERKRKRELDERLRAERGKQALKQAHSETKEKLAGLI